MKRLLLTAILIVVALGTFGQPSKQAQEQIKAIVAEAQTGFKSFIDTSTEQKDTNGNFSWGSKKDLDGTYYPAGILEREKKAYRNNILTKLIRSESNQVQTIYAYMATINADVSEDIAKKTTEQWKEVLIRLLNDYTSEPISLGNKLGYRFDSRTSSTNLLIYYAPQGDKYFVQLVVKN